MHLSNPFTVLKNVTREIRHRYGFSYKISHKNQDELWKKSVLQIQLLLLAKLTLKKLWNISIPNGLDCLYNEEEGYPDNGISPRSKFGDLPVS